MTTEFVTFGLQHAIATTVVVGAGIGLCCAVRSASSARLERAVRWGLAIACIAYEGIELVLLGVLPFHLCDLSILIAPVVLLTASRVGFELLYFWGIGGALQALITPAVVTGFPAPICIAFFLGHGLIIAGALYAAVVMRLRPTPRSILRVWLITIGYGLVMLGVNAVFGTNYLFIMRPPPTPSILDLLGPWPWYLLTLQPVILVVFSLCYLPYFARDRWSRRASPAPPR